MMAFIRRHPFILGLIVTLAALLLDQVSKEVILRTMLIPERNAIEILPVCNIVLVWNYGISFGMLATQRQPLLLTLMSIIIVCILLIWMYKNSSLLVSCALGSVIGGAIGNMADRMRFDAVVDFLDFHLGAYHWPAFNIADSCIFIGVVLLCLSSMFMEPHHKL